MTLTDVRRGARTLLRTPGFTIVAVLTVALGLAGTTAVTAIVSSVLVRPLPYPEADRLIGLWHTAPGLNIEQVEQSDGTYLMYRQATRSFEEIGSWDEHSSSLTGDQEPEHVRSSSVTASLFRTLRVAPALGTGITEADDRPGGSPIVVLSDALWARRFGRDRSILGSTLRIDGVAHRVVGVMPRGFAFPNAETQLWMPMRIDPVKPEPLNFNRYAIGRLRPGVTLDAARAEMTPLFKRIVEMPSSIPITAAMLEQTRMAVVLRPLRDDVVGDIRPTLLLVLGTVAVVLLIACANVANLFLLRAEGRQKEVAVRSAMGAKAGDLTRLFMAESFAICVAAGVLGVVLAQAGLSTLLQLRPDALPRAGEIRLDAMTLGVAVLLTLGTGVLFGLLPHVRRRESGLLSVLKEGGRGATVGKDRQRTRNGFVVMQVALALVLLVGSGLLARSFWQLRGVDPGFRAANLLTFRLALPEADYRDDRSVVQLYHRVADQLATIPGVSAVGAASRIPLVSTGNSNNGMWIEDAPLAPEGVPNAHPRVGVTEGYFAAMGIPIIEGRGFRRVDPDHPSDEMIVSRAFAKRYWPDGSAIGKRARVNPTGPWHTIVGVVGDVHNETLAKPAEPIFYEQEYTKDTEQQPTAWRGMAFVVRTAGDPMALAAAVRREVWSIDRTLPIIRLRSMEEVVRTDTARTTFTLLLVAVASSVALLLGAVGIYGVISYMVSLRTREIGVRLALGARPAEVRSMVVRQGLRLTGMGIAVGVVAALGLGRFVSAFLYGVAPYDPVTLASVTLVLTMVAALASWLPAARAAGIDPVEALRSE